jgi:anti-sigma-K factor RskA
MGSLTVHDLTAAYALDALEPAEAREYEEHLAHCERCRAELALLATTATSLAHAVEAPAPPPDLRERILVAARSERSNVVPLRARRPVVWQAVAAVAAAAAIGLGIWAANVSRSLDSERSARQRADGVLAVLADPAAQRVALRGRPGTLVVAPSGAAALVIRRLSPAPSGKTYEAWVIEGKTPQRAGTFAGGSETTIVPLEHMVGSGTTVAVTVERRGGVDAPQGPIVLSAKPV